MEYFAQALIAVITGTIIAVFTTQQAVRKMMAEKWWDRKWKAYSDILDALATASIYSKHCWETVEHIKSPEHISYDEYLAAVFKIKQCAAIGGLVIKDSAKSILSELPHCSTRDDGGAPDDVILSAGSQKQPVGRNEKQPF